MSDSENIYHMIIKKIKEQSIRNTAVSFVTCTFYAIRRALAIQITMASISSVRYI